jgi:hypothetical protein
MTVHHLSPSSPSSPPSPPSPPTRCRGDGPPLDVRAWRRCRLLEAGFPAELADRLAGDADFDLHALLELVDRGCPPVLAVRILAPLRWQVAR